MPTVTLRLIFTTDLHMQVTDFDYLQDRATGAGSLARLSPVIADLRAERPEAILLDGGDFLQGNPVTDKAASENEGGPHPMIAAMNALRYDVVAPGNHEFDYGMPFLIDALRDLRAQIVCANLRNKDGTPGPSPFTILTRELPDADGHLHPLRIAVVGFVTPGLDTPEAEADDIVEAARTALPAIKREGADLTVALCHSGLGAAEHRHRMENAVLPLAAVPGIDVILCGHTHDLFPDPEGAYPASVDAGAGTVHGTPVLQAGAYANRLGCLDLTLESGAKGWALAGHAPRLLPPSNHSDPAIAATVLDLHDRNRAEMARPLARATGDLHSWFEAIGRDLTLPVVADAYRRYANLYLGEDAPPVLVAVPSFRAGGRSANSDFLFIPEGPILQRNVAALNPFDNALCLVTRWGWQIREWLEFAAGRFAVVPDGARDAPLLNRHHPGYHMDTMFGLTYRIDLASPPLFSPLGERIAAGEGRVRDILHEGAPMEDDDLYIVATNTYRARGGGAVGPIGESDRFHVSDRGARHILAAYLQEAKIVTPSLPAIWSFVPQPGSRALFQTDAAAAPHLPPGVKVHGPEEGGRITLSLDLGEACA